MLIITNFKSKSPFFQNGVKVKHANGIPIFASEKLRRICLHYLLLAVLTAKLCSDQQGKRERKWLSLCSSRVLCLLLLPPYFRHHIHHLWPSPLPQVRTFLSLSYNITFDAFCSILKIACLFFPSKSSIVHFFFFLPLYHETRNIKY